MRGNIDNAWLAREYLAGRTSRELEKIVGIHHSNVLKRLKRFGVETSSHRPIPSGTRYGSLRVFERCGGGRAGVAYRCVCDCGNERKCLASNLRRGLVTACRMCTIARRPKKPSRPEHPNGPLCDASQLVVTIGRLRADGWSQRDLARAAGVSDRTIRRLGSGEQRTVRFDIADRLAIATGEDLDDLIPLEEAA